MPANPKAGKALLRRLPMEERFGMAQFSHLLGHTELNWRDKIQPSYADLGGGWFGITPYRWRTSLKPADYTQRAQPSAKYALSALWLSLEDQDQSVPVIFV